MLIMYTFQCLNLTEEQTEAREVDFIDIAYDDMNPKHYKETEDPKFYKSTKTGRGPLVEGWRDDQDPIMCSYKLVDARFEVWGLQTKVEDFIQRVGYIIYTYVCICTARLWISVSKKLRTI